MKNYIALFLISFFAFSCGNEKPIQVPANRIEPDDTKQQLLEMNRLLADKEQHDIQSFIQKNNWKMQLSPIGFWYRIDREGVGKRLEKDDFGRIEYSLSLLDGKVCADREPLVVKKGDQEEPRGIDEALGMLRTGGEATFIIPSNLAYGVVGDRKCVGSHAAIIYKVKLLEIRN